jgi:hypothetical protein
MIGGASIFMPEMVSIPQEQTMPLGYPVQQALPPSVVRGVAGREEPRAPARVASGPLTIPTPEQLGIAPKRRAAPVRSGPLDIPTPEQLGVASRRPRAGS